MRERQKTSEEWRKPKRGESKRERKRAKEVPNADL